ncbi:MAG: PD40 domain-containing protein [Chloroflexi bacterium]|nr:PD40 domain-containing protein [Chloroflexota bacterium]
MLNLEQLLRVPYVDSGLPYTISPDETRIVFSWNKTGRWELWSMSLRGRQPEAIPRSAGDCFVGESTLLAMTLTESKFSPRFSPDGTKIAFALDIDGSESYHIAIHDLTTNITTDLTPNILYAHQPNMSWSPDGQLLAVLSEAKGQFALYILPIDGSGEHMIRNIFHPCWDAAWSPDGLWIAVESEAAASDRSIHVVPVSSECSTSSMVA